MKLTIQRTDAGPDGIFGLLIDESGRVLAHTCEHAYEDQGEWLPKVPVGTYTALLGSHALSDLVPFKTYELQAVPGHDHILIHTGNTEANSHGCILLGESVGTLGGVKAVLDSRKAFDAFIALTAGAPSIEICVVYA